MRGTSFSACFWGALLCFLGDSPSAVTPEALGASRRILNEGPPSAVYGFVYTSLNFSSRLMTPMSDGSGKFS